MVLLSYKEVEGRKLQWQGDELCQKMHITKSSNQSVMQTKNSNILQYDSDEGSVESEESDNEESLNLGRVFEKSNENTFLIGHSSRFGRSVKLHRRYLY